jgi:hypothetical protein
MVVDDDVGRAHRTGRLAREGRPRTVIECFKSERRRDAVFKSWAILKTHIAKTI